jgi:hypothetical protein
MSIHAQKSKDTGPGFSKDFMQITRSLSAIALSSILLRRTDQALFRQS